MLPQIGNFNAMTESDAVKALEMLFEDAPGFLSRVATRRPFASYEELIDRAEAMAVSLSESDQMEVINGHPQIGADPASVSSHSYREQGYDGGQSPGDDLAARLTRLNAEYEQRFGFRFCVYVAGRSRAEVADIMASRLVASRDEEVQRGLSDVFAIARNRLAKLKQPLEDAR